MTFPNSGYCPFFSSSMSVGFVVGFGSIFDTLCHTIPNNKPAACPIYAPTTIVIGHFYRVSLDLREKGNVTCHSRSQSNGIGIAPNHAPINVPIAPQYVHLNTSTPVSYSNVTNCRRFSTVKGIEEDNGYVERRARCNAARKVC